MREIVMAGLGASALAWFGAVWAVMCVVAGALVTDILVKSSGTPPDLLPREAASTARLDPLVTAASPALATVRCPVRREAAGSRERVQMRALDSGEQPRKRGAIPVV